MSLTPIPGASRLRYFQLGLETVYNTTVAATRRVPWTFIPDVNPNTTFSTNDTGTLDQGLAPYNTVLDIVGPATGQAFSNDMATVISAGVMGGLAFTTSGTSKTLTAAPASISQDVFDTYTGQSSDDATADAWTFGGGVINDFALDYPQDGGIIGLTANWRFSSLTYPGTPTGGLVVDAAPVPLFATDTNFYINDTSGAIETTKLSDIAYSANFSVNNNLDIKRFSNGSNTRFQVRNFGRGLRTVSFSLVGAKQTAWIAEAAKWIAASPTERFFGILTQSTVAASAGIPHSLDIRFPGYWLTRTNQDVNSNTAFQLSAQNIYDSGLGYPFRMVSTSTRSAL